jgi:hypothetical protein
LGPLDEDVAARAILDTRSWQARLDAREREHFRRREDEARLADLAAARRRTAAHVVAARQS